MYAISLVAEMGVSVVESIVKLLTYEGAKIQDDLWLKPILQVEGQVALAMTALCSTRIRRNVDMWLPSVDPNSHKRGLHFERHLESQFHEWKSVNSVLGRHLTWTGACKPAYDKRTEEIDLSFSFGDVLVVVEARSRRIPITPLDYYNAIHEKESGIYKKVYQAERKARFVQDNLSEFVAEFYPHLQSRLADIKVCPLVIINDQFHAGFPCGTTPVLDEHLLGQFLGDGKVSFLGYTKASAKFSIVLYENLAQAEAIFCDYALRPTIIESYVLTLREHVNVQRIAEHEPPLHWYNYEITLPASESELKSVLNQLSLGILVEKPEP